MSERPVVPLPLISVVIPTCSADRYLPDCLQSLAEQTWREFEVIVVDNGSTDEAAAAVAEQFPWVRLIRLRGRQGFSKPVNIGCRAAAADLLFVLNDDTVLAPDCLTELLAAARARPEVSWFAALMVYHEDPGLVNSAAHILLPWGWVLDWGARQPLAGDLLTPQPVFGACAGAALYRKSMFDELGGFDERLRFLYEDVDLNFRAQLAGHACWTVPSARVQHRVAQSLEASSPAHVRALFHNAALCFLANLPPAFCRRYRRQVLYYWVMNVANQLRSGVVAPLVRAFWSAPWRAPRVLAKRAAQTPHLLRRGATIEQWAQWAEHHLPDSDGSPEAVAARAEGRWRRRWRLLGPALPALVLLAPLLFWCGAAALQDRWLARRLRVAARQPGE